MASVSYTWFIINYLPVPTITLPKYQHPSICPAVELSTNAVTVKRSIVIWGYHMVIFSTQWIFASIFFVFELKLFNSFISYIILPSDVLIF